MGICAQKTFLFSQITQNLSTRARLTLSGACPRRNSSRGIIGPGVTEYLKLMSDNAFFLSQEVKCVVFPCKKALLLGQMTSEMLLLHGFFLKCAPKNKKKFVRILFKTCYDAQILPLMIFFTY